MLKVTFQGEIEEKLRQLSYDTGLSITQIITQVFQKIDIRLPDKPKVKIELQEMSVTKSKIKERS